MSETLERLKSAMADVANAPKVKTKGGKLYTQVVTRVEMLRKWFGFDLSITTEIVAIDERVVIVKAAVADTDGRVLATGYAEEMRSGSGVNSTSALENGETSAVGRALAALGLGGGEYASADELAVALQAQRTQQHVEQQQRAAETHQQAQRLRKPLNIDKAVEAIRSAGDADTINKFVQNAQSRGASDLQMQSIQAAATERLGELEEATA